MLKSPVAGSQWAFCRGSQTDPRQSWQDPPFQLPSKILPMYNAAWAHLCIKNNPINKSIITHEKLSMNCSLNNRFYIIPSPVFVCEAGSVCSDSKLANKLTEASLNVDPVETTFILPRCFATSKAFAIVNSRVVKSRHNGAETGAVQVPVVCELRDWITYCSMHVSRENSFFFRFFPARSPWPRLLYAFWLDKSKPCSSVAEKQAVLPRLGGSYEHWRRGKDKGWLTTLEKKTKTKRVSLIKEKPPLFVPLWLNEYVSSNLFE